MSKNLTLGTTQTRKDAYHPSIQGLSPLRSQYHQGNRDQPFTNLFNILWLAGKLFLLVTLGYSWSFFCSRSRYPFELWRNTAFIECMLIMDDTFCLTTYVIGLILFGLKRTRS